MSSEDFKEGQRKLNVWTKLVFEALKWNRDFSLQKDARVKISKKLFGRN